MLMAAPFQSSNRTQRQTSRASTLKAAKSVENTLATLIAKHFSPDIADTIFEDGGVIEWLPELINHRRWRTLLYELMDQYPNCLMLNFAVKLISDAGFQTEISTVSSAAQQLDIFSRVLLTAIDTVLTEHRKGCITTAYEKAFGELARVVCQAEHTYVYTMALLKAVGSAQGGRILAACEQMSESLRAEMEGREHETTALRTALAQTADDQVASHFTQALLNMVSRGELNPADVTIIYDVTFDVCCQLYEKIAGENEAAEVIMERQRLVVDRLVHLLSVGGAIPVLEKVWEMFRDGQIDASLVRYFATEILEIIAPPFSDDLISLFLPLVTDEEIFDKAAHERFPAAGEFIQYCRDRMSAETAA
ncbi:hypothetical protein GCK32_009588 [Trichostrongylus colubriformis]|uniref:Uncharacterized protein n=1 Tax=Trichostrongylus colubriformis TaxID=6319 RepID=A0AAN8FC25_TRICO